MTLDHLVNLISQLGHWGYLVSRWREMRNLCILRTQEVGSRVQGSLRFVTLCYAIALMSLPSR